MEQKIGEIKKILEETDAADLPQVLINYRKDTRSGVIKLVERFDKKYKGYQKESERLEGMLALERQYASYSAICGIDEAGRGPLAGPVVAGAVILPKDLKIWHLNDSKQLSERQREELYQEIMEKAVSVGVGVVSHKRIDQINILQVYPCLLSSRFPRENGIPEKRSLLQFHGRLQQRKIPSGTHACPGSDFQGGIL